MFRSFRRIFSKLNLTRNSSCHVGDPCDPSTQVTILANGIRVATEYRPEPLACVALVVEAGSRFETACNNGITHFIEHMAYKGFVSMERSLLEESLLMMGVKMSADTQREIQTFTSLGLAEFAPNVVDVLARIITDLDLNDCAIEHEKHNMCLEMVDTDSDPRAVTFDYLHQTAFQGTPLAQRVIGPSKNVSKFDKSFATKFLSQHYQPYKLCVASSGMLNHDEMVKWTEARLGHLVGEAACQSDDGPCRFTGSQIIYRDDSMPFAHVAIAFEAPGYASPEYMSLLIASCMVGQWDRSCGGGYANGLPLARAAACADLCESFESFYLAYRDIGLWGIYFVADGLQVEDMLLNVQEEWMKLCSMTQSTDLERGVAMARLALARKVEGAARSCRDIGTELLYTCTRRSLADRWDALARIKVHAVRETCERLLYDRCPAVAAVGPTECLSDYTRIRAGQYWLRF
ncbi:Mitochondrial processing peptidase beta subunit [Operophtera brumata]|uniref:Mitochondrial processing peptidase beta subunit n=1 Tax=Operophtera brumata TaxID=104452 RepID=A0A0L7KUH5_OPEBR|nr:Mitochondrial processing peptidase beta subunit [Operophtera brumata]